MKLCYAEGNGSADIMTDDSLTKWVVGAGLAAMTAILSFLLRWVFGRLTGSVEELKAQLLAGNKDITLQLQRLTDTVQRQDTSIALMAKDIAHLQEQHFHLQREFEDFRSQQVVG